MGAFAVPGLTPELGGSTQVTQAQADYSGTLSPADKQTLIQEEAAQLVQASGGSLSMSDALAQANSDVNGALDQAGAQFTSPGFLGSSIGDWINGALDSLTNFSSSLWKWLLVAGAVLIVLDVGTKRAIDRIL